MEFWAKPDQTYNEHVCFVYNAWKETIASLRPLIHRLANLYIFDETRFLQGSLLTVALHDLGKTTVPFQEMMQAKRSDAKYDLRKYYRHELVSFVCSAYAWNELNKTALLSQVPVEALAIVGHHRRLDSDLTSFERERLAETPIFFKDGFVEALNLAKRLFEIEGWELPQIRTDCSKSDPYDNLAGLLATGILAKATEQESIDRVRTIYLTLKGILHYADWHGSGKVSVNYSIQQDRDAIVSELVNHCLNKGLKFSSLRPFQEKCATCSRNLIAVAPTGSGKTEAALLWATNNVQELGGAKILYLLPTMATANSIWQRLCSFFGSDNVGLTHSSANMLSEERAGEDEADKWENRRDVLFDQTFMKPVTVATVDQLLTTGFNAGRWTVKELNAANSVIVFDEIHAYEPWTVGLIIAAVKHFSKFGARFMFMSATLPKQLMELLSSALPNKPCIVEDTSLLTAKRSRYFVEERDLDDAHKEIEKAVYDGRRILVVVNTVGRCQELAERFSHLKPICFHSKFIFKDRKNIEERIDTAKFVIATQVVEVSLDIDFDWLFTECAPPDAITQRAGRVNRYRDPDRDSRVYIFNPSEIGSRLYNPLNDPGMLARTLDAFKEASEHISEQDLTEIVEKVYLDWRLEDEEPFKLAVEQYSATQKRRAAILDNRIGEDRQEVTRVSKYETKSVVPLCFKEEVLELKPAQRKWFEVKMPLWYFLRNKHEEYDICFCDMEYDSKLGARYLEETEIAIF